MRSNSQVDAAPEPEDVDDREWKASLAEPQAPAEEQQNPVADTAYTYDDDGGERP